MNTFKKILFFISPKERLRAILLLFKIIIMALIDMIGVASILPFMTILINPSLIETNTILKYLFDLSSTFGIVDNKDFLFVLGFFVFLLLIISLLFSVFTNYHLIKFIQRIEFVISESLMAGYLRQPYSWFLYRNSAELGKTILSEVRQLIVFGISPLIQLFAKGLVAIGLIILILLVNTKLGLLVIFILGGSYALIYLLLAKFSKQIGQKRLVNNGIRFKIVSEAFKSI